MIMPVVKIKGTKRKKQNKAVFISEKKVKTKVSISKEDFQDYEDVRASGATNMFDVRTVEMLSGLPREKIMTIMKNYGELNKKYPDVRRES